MMLLGVSCAKAPATVSAMSAPGALNSPEMQGRFEKSEDIADLNNNPQFLKDCPSAAEQDQTPDVIDEALISGSSFMIKTKISTFVANTSQSHAVMHQRQFNKSGPGKVQFKINVSDATGFSTAKISIQPGSRFGGNCQNHSGANAGVYCSAPYYNFLDGTDFDRTLETGCRILKDPGDGKSVEAGHGFFTFASGQRLEAWAEIRSQALAAVCPRQSGQNYFGTRRVMNVWVKSLPNPQILKACSTRVFRLSEDGISGYAALKGSLLMRKSEEIVGFN
jgi:hypothetical protein